ncbi:hypothetical protein ACFQYP_20495 [Nonomuraea antimicrobica]
MVSCRHSDHAEDTVAEVALARQRTTQPSVSFPAGTASTAWAPASTPATFPAQIWPLPCPSGAAGSCSISNSAVSASPRGSSTVARNCGVAVEVTVLPSTCCDGVTCNSCTAGAESGWSTSNCCQSDHAEASVPVVARTRQRTAQPSVSSPAGTVTEAGVPTGTPSAAPAQICPLPWPSCAAGSCSISNSARRSPPGA